VILLEVRGDSAGSQNLPRRRNPSRTRTLQHQDNPVVVGRERVRKWESERSESERVRKWVGERGVAESENERVRVRE
jgi:hypothetical protein